MTDKALLVDEVPSRQARSKDSARGTTCSIKNLNDDPTTYFFKIGNNQMFEQSRSSSLSEIGSNISNFSGPIAVIADPIHS